MIEDESFGNRDNFNANNTFPSDSNLLGSADFRGHEVGAQGGSRGRNGRGRARGAPRNPQGNVGIWVGGTLDPGITVPRGGREANGNVAPRHVPEAEREDVDGNRFGRVGNVRRSGGKNGRGGAAGGGQERSSLEGERPRAGCARRGAWRRGATPRQVARWIASEAGAGRQLGGRRGTEQGGQGQGGKEPGAARVTLLRPVAAERAGAVRARPGRPFTCSGSSARRRLRALPR